MPLQGDPAFLVNAYSEPVLVKVRGRASFQNSAPLGDFLQAILREGKERIVLDFSLCTGMDSTFLGILAGVALEIRQSGGKASLVLCNLSRRNLELVRNLGLHRLLTVDADPKELSLSEEQAEALPAQQQEEIEQARTVLAAHENLVEVDESNRGKFQDVLTFLRNRLDSGEGEADS